MKEVFDNYVLKFDMTDENIFYKYYHSFRVMTLCEELAKNLNLSSYDIEVAKVIGLFHDIGRFNQRKMNNSFDDTLLDHGNYGESLLRESNMLSNLGFDDDLEVIYKAISNHNKLKIEEGLNERELFFSKIIRDADKLDIIYALGDEKLRTIKQVLDNVTLEVGRVFLNNCLVSKSLRKNYNDSLILIFSFIYDINFGYSFKILKERKYYDKLYDRIENKELFKDYYEHLKEYINERIDKNVSK